LQAALFLVPSIFLSLLPQLLLITVITEAVVATDHFAAALAPPQFLLLPKEFPYSVFFDELQIAYQTHSIMGSVSFINCLQSVAGKALALETEGDFAFGQFNALLLQKRTVLSSQSAAYAPGHPDSLCLQVILQCQVA
jgi:hypothetical protein